MKNRKLKHHLFLTSLILVTVSFLSLLFAFHFIIQMYMENVTSQSINNELLFMELIYYKDQENNEELNFEDENFIIMVNHLIVGESGDIVSDDIYYVGDRNKNPSKSIADYLVDNRMLKDGDVQTISYNGRNYFVKIKYFDTTRPNSLAAKAGQKYYAVVFSDVSSIHQLRQMLNRILGILVLLIGIPSILISYFNSKKIEQSFSKLQNYIVKLGKREVIDSSEDFSFDEFNQMKNTTLEISKKLNEAEMSREVFFQNASHELRTPLMSIHGYAESIAKNVSSNPVKAAEIILSESWKMKSLVDDILTISRIESGAHRLKIEEMDVKEFLNSCIADIQKTAKDREIEIICNFEKQGFFFDADEDKLSHAVTNILSNAVRYAKTYIEIRYETVGEYAKLYFLNDGEPIEEEDLPYIFDRFYKGKNGKFGIGLALCKEIIKLHHGEVFVDSDQKITCFTIALPLKAAV